MGHAMRLTSLHIVVAVTSRFGPVYRARSLLALGTVRPVVSLEFTRLRKRSHWVGFVSGVIFSGLLNNRAAWR